MTIPAKWLSQSTHQQVKTPTIMVNAIICMELFLHLTKLDHSDPTSGSGCKKTTVELGTPLEQTTFTGNCSGAYI
jgi:hypothetical protein